jgi:hypothetical protein
MSSLRPLIVVAMAVDRCHTPVRPRYDHDLVRLEDGAVHGELYIERRPATPEKSMAFTVKSDWGTITMLFFFFRGFF